MVRKGPQRLKLEQYLDGADPHAIGKMSTSLTKYGAALANAALEVDYAVARIKRDLKGHMPEAAQTSMRTSSHHMQDRGDSVAPAKSSLQTASESMATALTALGKMKDVPDDPPPADQSTDAGIKQQAANQTVINDNQAAYEAQEKQAAELTTQLDTDNQAAVEELKKIHGIPDPPPASGGGSPQGPSGPGNAYDGFKGGDGGPKGPDGGMVSDPFPVRNPTLVGPVLVHPEVKHPNGNVVWDPWRVKHPDDVDNNDDGHNGNNGNDGGNGGNDGNGDGDGGPFEGVSADGSGTSGRGFLGGGLSGAATAGIIGGAGLGLGALGLAGRAIAGRGVPGLSGSGRIGATSRTAGSAVTGRGAAAGAGSRTSRSAGRAGAGAGAKGKGGAGGRGGAGGGAGGRGKGKKDRAKGTVWDGVEDGEQWLDDDNATGSVID